MLQTQLWQLIAVITCSIVASRNQFVIVKFVKCHTINWPRMAFDDLYSMILFCRQILNVPKSNRTYDEENTYITIGNFHTYKRKKLPHFPPAAMRSLEFVGWIAKENIRSGTTLATLSGLIFKEPRPLSILEMFSKILDWDSFFLLPANGFTFFSKYLAQVSESLDKSSSVKSVKGCLWGVSSSYWKYLVGSFSGRVSPAFDKKIL